MIKKSYNFSRNQENRRISKNNNIEFLYDDINNKTRKEAAIKHDIIAYKGIIPVLVLY